MTAKYDTIGLGYESHRQPDAAIGRAVLGALGDAQSVLNVGAGTGSYEPVGRSVVAVEPSSVMHAQRAADAAPGVRAFAEHLPFAADTFDAAMAILTIHHWTDWRQGVAEMRRISRNRAVVLTHDPVSDGFSDYWLLRDYLPELLEVGGRGMPPLDELCAELGGEAAVLPIAADCADGFLGAYWKRPEQYLDPAARTAISAFHSLPKDILDRGLAKLAEDLKSGVWADRNAELDSLQSLDLGYRLVVAEPTR